MCILHESGFVRVWKTRGLAKLLRFLAQSIPMNHLILSSDLNRIENQLLMRRDQLVQATSWTFNVAALLFVLASFVYFLYVSYNNESEAVEEQRIPFKPVTWYSATRNVRSEEYGQPIEIEAGYGLSGLGYGNRSEALL